MPAKTLHPVALDATAPAEVDAGAPFALTVAVETPSGRDLSGAPWELLDAGRVIAAGALPPLVAVDPASDAYDPRHGPVDLRPTATLTLTAPDRIGPVAWTLRLPPAEIDGAAHAGAEAPVAFAARAHRTSLAVWGVGSPATAGGTVRLKVGARCSAGCSLAGRRVELVDPAGEAIAAGTLGGTPLPDTGALYWTALAAPAPRTPGRVRWTARLAAADHPEAIAGVGVTAAAPGAHRVSITLVAKDGGAPLADAMVRLGLHRRPTDAAGAVSFEVPEGEHALYVSAPGYEVPERRLAVAGDLDLPLAAAPVPPEDPYARWTG